MCCSDLVLPKNRNENTCILLFQFMATWRLTGVHLGRWEGQGSTCPPPLEVISSPWNILVYSCFNYCLGNWNTASILSWLWGRGRGALATLEVILAPYCLDNWRPSSYMSITYESCDSIEKVSVTVSQKCYLFSVWNNIRSILHNSQGFFLVFFNATEGQDFCMQRGRGKAKCASIVNQSYLCVPTLTLINQYPPILVKFMNSIQKSHLLSRKTTTTIKQNLYREHHLVWVIHHIA